MWSPKRLMTAASIVVGLLAFPPVSPAQEAFPEEGPAFQRGFDVPGGGYTPGPGHVDPRSLRESFDRRAEQEHVTRGTWRDEFLGRGGADSVVLPSNSNVFHASDCTLLDPDDLASARRLPNIMSAVLDRKHPCSECFSDIESSMASFNFGHNLRLSEQRVRIAYQACLRSLSRAVRYGVGVGQEMDRARRYIEQADAKADEGLWLLHRGSSGADYDRARGALARAESDYEQAGLAQQRAGRVHARARAGEDEFKNAFRYWVEVSIEENNRIRGLIIEHVDPHRRPM
jgi:hypothetical protein